jgi:TolA-binding protein
VTLRGCCRNAITAALGGKGAAMRLFAIGTLLVLSACGQSESERLKEENQNLRDQVDQLQSQLSSIKEKADDLETASSTLQDQLARFQNEDWKEVMPDAQEADEQVESAQQELSDTVDD